jgi:Heparinase II/III-like protein
MKNQSLLFTAITLIFLAVNPLFAQLKSFKDPKSIPDHPRLLLLKGEEEAIKNNVKNDKNWAKIHQIILSECDKLVKTPPLKRIQIGKRLLDVSRECLRRVFFLSYAYRMTGDKKYLHRADTEMLTVSRFSDWNPSHFLDVAEMTMGVAIGYDWLYHDLPKTTLDSIKTAIYTKGIQPSLLPKNNYWQRSYNNWNQVCNAGMSFGALAIYEDSTDLAIRIVERAIETIKVPMKEYAPDGAYPEGYSYWGYGTSFNVLFISAIERVFKSDFNLATTEGFNKTAAYFENLMGTSGETFNYSDAGAGRGSLNPAMFWFAQRNNDPSLLVIEKSHLANSDKSMAKDRILPAVMIWGKDINFSKIEAPKELIWSGQGKNPVAMMRTSWSNPDAIYVGLKAGSPSVSHGHMDIGSFVMDAKGERWAMDFGMQNYETLESKGVKLWGMEQNAQRWEILRYNNFFHNTLSFDSSLQKVGGYAPLSNVSKNPQFLSATTDMSAVYKGSVASAKRGIAIVDQNYVVVKDEIEGGEKETTVRWVMLTAATVKIIDNQTAELSRNGKTLQLKVPESSDVVLKTWSTTPKRDYDAPNPNTILVGFEVKIPAKTKRNLTVLLLPNAVKQNKVIPALKDW